VLIADASWIDASSIAPLVTSFETDWTAGTEF
jgi:hypothetical protein